jgi:hypothetical protein
MKSAVYSFPVGLCLGEVELFSAALEPLPKISWESWFLHSA